ncbi:MAG: patatin-like phospholipase family protein [Ignavibacteriae bacterium]|nr:patatin-like phospholipase family protein [Ignavibacteriota bacterium]
MIKQQSISSSKTYRIITGLLVLIILSVNVQSQTTIRVPKSNYKFDGLKLKRTTQSKHPKVGLVLSGGGARGLAQIGVLRALEKHNIPIDFIVGNSMGSVIGGLYASGYSTAELESIATYTNWDEVLSFTEGTKRTELFIGQKRADDIGFLTIRFDGLQPIIPSSVSSGQRLINYFMNLTLQSLYHPDSTFDDLKIPFRAVAVDLIKGKRTIIDRGSLAEAMRSSITVPLLYTPLERDSMALVDGGLISNIPVDVAVSTGCDIIIAVNSTSGLRRADQMTAPWEVADQIMTIIMQQPNERQLQCADVVIVPETGERLVDDFSGIDSLIIAGEQATTQYLNKIILNT